MPFSAVSAEFLIAIGAAPNQDAFALEPSFILSSTAPAINPVSQAVTFQAGTFNTTIPPGSFKEIWQGIFAFHGVIGGVRLEVLIAPTGSLRYALVAAAQDANLTGTKNPVPVMLIIGGDSGTASVTARIARQNACFRAKAPPAGVAAVNSARPINHIDWRITRKATGTSSHKSKFMERFPPNRCFT